MTFRALAAATGVLLILSAGMPGPGAVGGPPCPWDCGTMDDIVGVGDLLAMLGQWDTTNPPCDGGGLCDFDGNGCVEVSDMLMLLGRWGLCPGIGAGACCLTDGSCADGTQSGCFAAGGTYQGDGTDCVSAGCPQPGACCLPDDTCIQDTQRACEALGGAYQGDELTCAAANCVPVTLAVQVIATVDMPTWVGHAPGDAERLFVMEKSGRIRIIVGGTVLPDPFLDLTQLVDSSGAEQGLLGLAFDPDYATNGLFHVYYTRPDNAVVVARYQVTADPEIADPGSAWTVMVIPKPGIAHNGGWIGFGPDGYLYLAVGNGPGLDSQSLEILLGKMLRIDVAGDDFPADPARNYAIPPDNPFAGTGWAGEIWAFGLRNPWRAGFDPATGDLYIGDVGLNGWEELNFQPAGTGGANYGWNCKEGTHCTGLTQCSCADPDLVDPIFEYANPPNSGAAIIAGVVYRGCAIPDLVGAYIFADHYVNNGARIWKLRHDGSGTITELEEIQEIVAGQPTGTKPASFGVDAAGEIYFTDLLGGEIFKIVPAGGGACP